MAIEIKWVINGMLTAPSEDGLTDVVKSINWTRVATEQVSDKTYVASFPGTTPCPTPSSQDFIPYADLTESDVDNWLNQLVDVVTLDASLTKNIQDQINPPVIELPLPWVTTTTTTVAIPTTTTTTVE